MEHYVILYKEHYVVYYEIGKGVTAAVKTQCSFLLAMITLETCKAFSHANSIVCSEMYRITQKNYFQYSSHSINTPIKDEVLKFGKG